MVQLKLGGLGMLENPSRGLMKTETGRDNIKFVSSGDSEKWAICQQCIEGNYLSWRNNWQSLYLRADPSISPLTNKLLSNFEKVASWF